MVAVIIISAVVIAHKIGEQNQFTNENTVMGTTTQVENETNSSHMNMIQQMESSTQNKELFESYYQQAEELMETMTLEEKVGQLFLARYPEKGAKEEIKNQNPGGYILFSRDFKNRTKQSMKKQLLQNQQISKIPLILGVDEEGGSVVRVSGYKAFRNTPFLSSQTLWKQGQLQAILTDSKEKSELLASMGCNMNLTPVADVPTKTSSFMYQRSYGRGAEKTAVYVSELIQTMNQSNMISVMKHFPGYGDNVDTHTGIAIDERPYTTFETSDFLPFKRGIETGGPCILVSHNAVTSMDSEKPASLSEKVHQILREKLGFTGIIITDDLAMDAVKSYATNGEAAIQAVLAGNDMIISSDFTKQKEEIINGVKQQKIDIEIIHHAVKRILAWKMKYQIIK